MYPRLCVIKRPRKQSGTVGIVKDYAADEADSETVVKSDVRASIQARSASGKNPVNLPGDGMLTTWKVLTPKAALSAGDVIDRDLIYDDLGRKFQVVADYSNSLGGSFIAVRLEA